MRPDGPCLLTLEQGLALPSGPLRTVHRSLQRGVREWVEQQTGVRLGHVEQLYTFTDMQAEGGARRVLISYLALTRQEDGQGDWRSVYDYFPWEDRRKAGATTLLRKIVTLLAEWAGPDGALRRRLAVAFGLEGEPWNDDLALGRYELLWQAGLVPESSRGETVALSEAALPGMAMRGDFRRVLATALSRIRAKIRYTPAVFDLVPAHFTLLQLQQTMEALTGHPMHKQNFRRLVLHQGVVEETAAFDTAGQGRPARLYRFRPGGAENCYLAGAKLPLPALS